MKSITIDSVDKKLSMMNKDNQKIFIVPANFGDPVKESDKSTFPSMDIKPTLFIPEFYEKGLDNPAYYDPADVRRTARMDAKKQKFTSKSIPGESDGAKLTKIPGLNIWRLDFRKPASKSQPSSAPWFRLTTTIAMLAIMALIISGVAVIAHAIKGGVIFGMPWFPFEGENEALGVDRVAAHFRIMNREFVSELRDHSSKEHAQLVAELKHSLDVLFMDSPLINFYNASDNFEFTNGSVVVRCIVFLNHPLSDGAQKVGYAFVRALEEGKGILPPGMFYIDVHTVRFAAVKMDSEDISHNILHETGQWTEWSSCMKNGSCDSSRIRVRRKYCGTSVEDLCASHTEIVETRPCLCPLPDFIATLTTSSLLLPGYWSEWSAWSSCLSFNHLCDPSQIQRRTRNCFGFKSKTLPTTVCHRKSGESAIQIRHCICEQSHDDE
ncbi:SEA domain-containing protein [Caerostris darwini]|uniref:SEA domain-containing protein n=1 Tax=Caerostris darwini TaxID=1538125 RepID=A0AAV4UN99_9ARAC|nr:SEA domain-containing protein [Caerostris darwini]